MLHTLVSCDCCTKIVPHANLQGWWGLTEPSGNVPVMSFAPLNKSNFSGYGRHVCGQACLEKVLHAMAETVDMAKVAAAKPNPSFADFGNIFKWSLFSPFSPPSNTPNDSIGYYGKKKAEDAPDDEEECE